MTSLDRRSFVTLAAGAALAAASRQAAAETGGFPAGIQLYAVAKPLEADTPGTLKRLHAIGYREVETAGFAGHTAAEFRGLCDAAGLTIPSAHLPFNDATDIGPLLAEANTLGAHFATSSLLGTTRGAPADAASVHGDGFRQVAARMNEFGRQAHAAGLQYAYHNHNHEFPRMPDGHSGYEVLLRETDAALVKFEMDCGWVIAGGGDPIALLKQYPGRIRMLHVKDFKKRSTTFERDGPTAPLGIELGRGSIDYHPIFAAARGAGVQHIFVEQEAPYERPEMESAEISYRYLQSL